MSSHSSVTGRLPSFSEARIFVSTMGLIPIPTSEGLMRRVSGKLRVSRHFSDLWLLQQQGMRHQLPLSLGDHKGMRHFSSPLDPGCKGTDGAVWGQLRCHTGNRSVKCSGAHTQGRFCRDSVLWLKSECCPPAPCPQLPSCPAPVQVLRAAQTRFPPGLTPWA